MDSTRAFLLKLKPGSGSIVWGSFHLDVSKKRTSICGEIVQIFANRLLESPARFFNKDKIFEALKTLQLCEH